MKLVFAVATLLALSSFPFPSSLSSTSSSSSSLFASAALYNQWIDQGKTAGPFSFQTSEIGVELQGVLDANQGNNNEIINGDDVDWDSGRYVDGFLSVAGTVGPIYDVSGSGNSFNGGIFAATVYDLGDGITGKEY